MTNKQILETLPKLSKAELKKIRDKLNYLLKEENNDKESDKELELFYIIITNEIRLTLKVKNTEFYLWKKKSINLYKKLIEIREILDMQFKELVNSQTRKVNFRKWYILFSRLICIYIVKNNLSLTVTEVVNNHDRFLSLLNSAYPDYISSGFINIILDDI